MTRRKTSVIKRPNSNPKVTSNNFFLRWRGRFMLWARSNHYSKSGGPNLPGARTSRPHSLRSTLNQHCSRCALSADETSPLPASSRLSVDDPTPGREVRALEKTMATSGSPRWLSRLPADDLQAALLSQNLQTLDRENPVVMT